MLSAAKFLLLAALVLALGWWVGTLPGDVTANAGAYVISTSTPLALLILFLIAVLFSLMLWLLGRIYRAPRHVANWRGGRRQTAGEIATQRGLVALAAGDAPKAQAEAAKAHKLLGETPLTLLLRADAARLAGDVAGAKAAFQKLSLHKEMRFLGHRGLVGASLEEADSTAAARHALNAEAAYPGAAWTRAQRLALAIKAGDFPLAVTLTTEKNEIAALALAAAAAAPSAREALRYAQMAEKAVPYFPPAVAAKATAQRALGKLRGARKTLLAGWRGTPHPLTAAAWLAPAATPLEQAQAAVTLAAANPGHAESELVLAQTALAAGLVAEAERHAGLALAAGPDDGRAQAVLDTLHHKPPAAIRSGWICDACHHATPDWAALCPNCAAPGSLRWRTTGTALI